MKFKGKCSVWEKKDYALIYRKIKKWKNLRPKSKVSEPQPSSSQIAPSEVVEMVMPDEMKDGGDEDQKLSDGVPDDDVDEKYPDGASDDDEDGGFEYDMNTTEGQAIHTFCEMTNEDEYVAVKFLQPNQWNVQLGANAYSYISTRISTRISTTVDSYILTASRSGTGAIGTMVRSGM